MDARYVPFVVLFMALFAAKAQEFYSERIAQEDPDVESSHLQHKVDQAIVTVNATNVTSPLYIFYLSDYCHNCAYYSIANITIKHKHTSASFHVNSIWGSNLMITGSSCSLHVRYHFGERANYVFDVYENETGGCYNVKGFVQLTEPYKTNAPIGVGAAILVGLCIVYLIVDEILRKRRGNQFEALVTSTNTDSAPTNTDSAPKVSTVSGEVQQKTAFLKNTDLGTVDDIQSEPTSTPPPRPVRDRMVSVDSFRGLCIVIMVFVNYKGGRYWFFHHASWDGELPFSTIIDTLFLVFNRMCIFVMVFVNYGGGHYWFFTHVAWDGLTVADLVFPWFMFIMGINIVFSIDSMTRRETPALEIAYKIVRRTLILFFLGLCIINHNTDIPNMRIPGVLQRFALAYLVVTLMQWAFHKKKADINTMAVMASSGTDEGIKPGWYRFRDVVLYWPQWVIIAIFETVWHCLTFLLPVEGCPTGYIGPGGLAENSSNFNCTGGAAGFIDRKVFGDAHIYGHPTAKTVYYPPDYKNIPVKFDPEGLLGSFHSILIVFLGLQAGKIFLYYEKTREKIVRFISWCVLLGVLSAILTKCSQYDGWIPVNKNLWSTSFVTTLSCFAFAILCVMYIIIDVKKLWSGVPFYFVGMNSIFIYVGHEVFQGYLPFAWGAGDTATHGELLAMNMLGTAYWVIIAYYCYKIKFFVKI